MNMAVFKDFKWDNELKETGNKIAEFKDINILYGRNYSGKTTLSRIFRAMEINALSPRYQNPEFNVEFSDGAIVDQNNLIAHNQTIRVFNEDFIKDNLHFIINDEQSINSFAILGEDNTKIEDEIRRHEIDLGSEENKTGLLGKLAISRIEAESAQELLETQKVSLEDKLKDKANKTGSGIKHNKQFGDANYNVLKIKADIDKIISENFKPISVDDVQRYIELLKEEPKPTISELSPFGLGLRKLSEKAQSLVEKKIQVSNPIKELVEDALLDSWVRMGRDYHKSKRTKCAFCGNDIPVELWDKLDNHYNKESETLRNNIDMLYSSIEDEINRIPNLLKIEYSQFYSNFAKNLDSVQELFDERSSDYIKSLKCIQNQLAERKSDIFKTCVFKKPDLTEINLEEVHSKYEEFRLKSNGFTTSLSKRQSDARTILRLNEVCRFIQDIQYKKELREIDDKGKQMQDVDKVYKKNQSYVNEKQNIIKALKAQLKDESKGAEKVNQYLNSFFGHQSLKLKAIENTESANAARYQFEVTRNDSKAYHLSEGECSLIAFCYFMAKLEDVETKGSRPIIWIDDPISSLDSNHIYFVYSLINAEIIGANRFLQIFISTHNLEFFKYLKRLPGALKTAQRKYLLVQRNGKTSTIALMPKYLKDYVTEFNYLFHQIYKCANADVCNDSNHDCFYNFGNNARKFLEAFLFYKYPSKQDGGKKLSMFFGDNELASSFIDRINNEYSHLEELFERSMVPIEIPEMKTSAQFILRKIKENDKDQYMALLESIGELPDSSDGAQPIKTIPTNTNN